MNFTSIPFRRMALPAAALIALGAAAAAKAGALNKVAATVGVPPPEADAEAQAVLDALISLGGKPIEKLTPAEARQQPSPADAVKKVLQSQGKPTEPQAMASTKTLHIDGPLGDIPLHIYTPDVPKANGPLPIVLYFHGGGFVIANTEVYDASIRAIAAGANAIVVSVDYHQAPEHKFPAAPDDAYVAYTWVREHAAEINGDAVRIAVAGESAGGNLAVGVSLRAREKGDPLPVHQVLIYPVVDNNLVNTSYLRNAAAKPLNSNMMPWFFKHYMNGKRDGKSQYALPNRAHTLVGLPASTVITAEIDPLRSEGCVFAERLKKDGVSVEHKDYAGVPHEFFGWAGVSSKAREAQVFVNAELRQAFGTTS